MFSILYLPNSKSQQRKEKATRETQRRIELQDRVRNNAPALKVTECGLQKKEELFFWTLVWRGEWGGGKGGDVLTGRKWMRKLVILSMEWNTSEFFHVTIANAIGP